MMFFSAFQQGQYAEPANGYILIYDQGLSESDIKLLIKFFWWHQNSFEISRNSVRACDPNLIPVSKLPYNQRAGMMPRFCQNSLNKTSNWADRFFFSVWCQRLLCVSHAWRCAASKALKSIQIAKSLFSEPFSSCQRQNATPLSPFPIWWKSPLTFSSLCKLVRTSQLVTDNPLHSSTLSQIQQNTSQTHIYFTQGH